MKRSIRSLCAGLFVAGLALVTAGAQGCSRKATVRDACQSVCDCYTDSTCPSDSPTIDECVKNADAQQKVADEAGCRAEFDAYIQCIADYDGSCGPGGVTPCNEENTAYNQCGAGS